MILILPLGVTVIVINFLLDRLGTPASELFFWFLDSELRALPAVEVALEILSILVVIVLITLLGYGSRLFIGRMLMHSFERVLDRVPLINMVYRTVKQIVDTFSRQHKAVFQEVVLIEYPRPRSYAIGFLTSTARGETQAVTGEKIVNVFVPTTPNPTSGFLLMLPEKDTVRLQMSIADGMKLIISGGAVIPPFDASKAVPVANPPAAEGKAE